MLLATYQSLPDTNRSTVQSLKHQDTTLGSERRLLKAGRLSPGRGTTLGFCCGSVSDRRPVRFSLAVLTSSSEQAEGGIACPGMGGGWQPPSLSRCGDGRHGVQWPCRLGLAVGSVSARRHIVAPQ